MLCFAPNPVERNEAMQVVIVGGGIGGLTLGLMLHARGLACRMVKHLRGGAELRVALTRAPTTEAMRDLLAAAGSLVYESAA